MHLLNISCISTSVHLATGQEKIMRKDFKVTIQIKDNLVLEIGLPPDIAAQIEKLCTGEAIKIAEQNKSLFYP